MGLNGRRSFDSFDLSYACLIHVQHNHYNTDWELILSMISVSSPTAPIANVIFIVGSSAMVRTKTCHKRSQVQFIDALHQN